ncbi:MAG: hypothetical protein ACUZ8H_16445 [Candidatus Anammoxibacter sp.]
MTTLTETTETKEQKEERLAAIPAPGKNLYAIVEDPFLHTIRCVPVKFATHIRWIFIEYCANKAALPKLLKKCQAEHVERLTALREKAAEGGNK